MNDNDKAEMADKVRVKIIDNLYVGESHCDKVVVLDGPEKDEIRFLCWIDDESFGDIDNIVYVPRIFLLSAEDIPFSEFSDWR